MILEDQRGAAEQAERLAAELILVRPDLRCRGSIVRVRDQNDAEVCRTTVATSSVRKHHAGSAV
ncbi:hypothetical protein [Bradyrhizobium sp. RDM4]|uniref:hypothetical protein n=1 Tax=Bradyrhizobium sp. RDM4 TaxID=3378765 RepID=UPI0038FC4D80